jgi:hypothetical protein
LKAKAVMLAAETLVRHGIIDLPSWRSAEKPILEAAARDFRAINGQGTGVSWTYLYMLAGDDDEVKPDRMVIRYVEAALKQGRVPPHEAGELLIAAAAILRGTHGYPSILSPRQLDWAVWSVARSATESMLLERNAWKPKNQRGKQE